MGKSVRVRSLLLRPQLQAALMGLLFTGCLAAAQFSSGVLLPVIGIAAAMTLPALAWYWQHELLRRRNAVLRQKNLRFQVAVNNITQALLMFDPEGRLVLCNDRYLQMYGLAPEKVRPGTSLRTLLTYRKELGTFPGDPEQYCKAILADLATGKPTSNASELSDGRVIAVVNQPLPGGAWVSTHQDITELHGAQKDAQQAHERLTAVIDAMPAGLIFYDDQDRLVLSNKYYTDMHAATAEVG